MNQALAPLLPQLTGSGSYGRARTVGVIIGNAGYQDFGAARLTASQLLFDFGRTWAAKDVAKSNAEALKEVLEAQKLDISQLVKTQYFTLLLSKRLVEVNVAALDRAQVNLRSAQGFFQVGTQPKSFVTRAEVDVANARVNVIRAQNAVGLSRVALNAAMGIAVNAPTEVKDLLSYQDFPTDRDLLVSEALRNRPEYRQVKAQADAADALVRQTFRDFFPNLTGTGNYGLVGDHRLERPDLPHLERLHRRQQCVGGRAEARLVHLRRRRPGRPLQGGQGRGRGVPGPGPRRRAADLAERRADLSEPRRGRAADRGRPEGGGVGGRELPALPGALRRGGRQHHRAHRRPARPDPGPVRRGAGPVRLPHRHRETGAGPGPPVGIPRAPGASDTIMKRRLLWIVGIVVAAGVITGGYLYTQGIGARPAFRTAAVSRGPLTSAVSATGTLNAVITVLVGSQVSGQVKELFADFNSQVKKDQVIARIDPEIFEAKVSQVKAQVDAAQASVLNQQAAVEKTRADLENVRAAFAAARAQTAKSQVTVVDSKRTLGRNRDLRQRGLIAQADEDTAQAAYDSAVAQVEASKAQEDAQVSAVRAAEAQLRVSEAMLKNAAAQVVQNEAALRQAQVDLERTFIRAPVDGTVVGRSVDVGQTVAASLQAPTLFTIAQDLRNMQVDTNVDEADVGRVKVGQTATFTVDSFPGRTFTGEVVQIRKAPLVVQNVVTYDVVVTARNPEQRLLPGMTANVRIVIEQKESVLQVPNAALRFRPARDGSPRA